MLHLYRQITALRAYQPVVFCQKRENAAAFPFDPVVILPKPRTHQLRRFVQKTLLGQPITIYRSEARRILEALHTARARVLHIYFGHIGVHLLPLLEICDLPVIVSFHGADAQVDLDKPANRAATQRMLAKATLLLVRSQSITERLIALGAEPGKIRLHRTGLPLDQIPFVQREVPADGAWRCVQACRLIAKKGLATSLRAFAEFTHTYPAATFTIAGEGPFLADLQALAIELNIADRVTFPGFLPQEKLRALYAGSHLFLHPSELGPDGDQEGVPNSLLEAMASGLPVLATRHGGIPEAVEDGVTGLLVAERDHRALAQAMFLLAGDQDRYRAMSSAGSASVRAHFDLAEQARILGEYYSAAIAAFASGMDPTRTPNDRTKAMIRAVLDTNVILAALLSNRGAAFEILQRLRRGEWQLVLSNHLLLEYEEVLKRNAPMLSLTPEDVDRFLNSICQTADCFSLPAPQPPRLPDADDEPLLQLAETSGARLITTHNLRHLRPAAAHGVTVLPPRDFLRMLVRTP